jgi:adenylate cyclase
MAEERVKRKLTTIFAADVEGYSRLMNADEEATLKTLGAYRDIIDPMIARHEGRIFNTGGDSVLAEFTSAVEAVRCAIAFQEEIAGRNAQLADDRKLVFRIGINVGDVMVRDGDLFGDGVNLAARLEGLCGSGEVYVSGSVHDQVVGKLEVSFDDLGQKVVKNIARPIRAYRALPMTGTPVPAGADVAPPLPDKPSVAVLPFDNISGDPEQEYFSDGITEDIITDLSKISGLFVIARHSTLVYKDKIVALKQIGRELGVRYVLEGSVRKAGNRLRITAQLIDSLSDHHLWAERYDRELDDIFAVQEEVARQVAEALEVALKPDEGERLAHAPTRNIEAYDVYRRARMTFWPPTRANILTARSAYAQVIDSEPTFAGGHAGKSMTHSMAALFGHSERPDEDARIALELAERAITEDKEFALSHSALGFAYMAMERREEAVAAVRRAVEFQPGDADSHAILSQCLSLAGHGEEARDAALTALRLDPQYVAGPYINALGRACFVAERYEEAIEAWERNIARGGPFAAPMLTAWVTSHVELGQMEKAREITLILLQREPDYTLASVQKNSFSAPSERVEQMIDALRQAGVPE